MKSNFLLAVFLLLSLVPVSGTAYFFSPTGKDSNSGTSEKETWKSIDKLNQVAQTTGFKAGDKILFLGPYVYSGSIQMVGDHPKAQANMGSRQAPILITSYGKGVATIYSGDSYGLMIRNAAGYEVRNLIFRGSGGEHTALNGTNRECGVLFYNDRADSMELSMIRLELLDVSGYQKSGIMLCAGKTASQYRDITITHCTSHDNGEAGISSYSDMRYSLVNVHVSHCKAYQNSGITSKLDNHSGNGIVMAAVDGGIIEFNEANDNGWMNPCDGGGPVGIWVWHSNNILMQYNESHHNRTNSLKDGGGFDFDGGTNQSIMQYNYSHDNDGAGYLLAQFWGANSMANNIIRYNISENDGRKNGYGGITIWGGDRFSDCDIYNNAVFVDDENLRDTVLPAAVQFLGNHFDRVYLRNNVFISNGMSFLINADTVGLRTENALLQNNCYYAMNRKIKIKWGAEILTSFELWKKLAENQEMLEGKSTEILKNPMLKNPGKAGMYGNPSDFSYLVNYQPEAGSPLVGVGLDITTAAYGGFSPAKKDMIGNTLPHNGKIDVGVQQK